MREMYSRDLKRYINELMKSSGPDSILNELRKLPAIKVINALFSFLLNTDPEIKWTAVILMGAFVKKIADENIEKARVIMRRLMWNLNDESGGIGWGSPEAMGEILACHKGLAEEYFKMLLSYTREDGNYLENEMLQRGLLWGIGRLAQVRPELVQDSVQYIPPYLESNDAVVRGLALWVLSMLDAEPSGSIPERLKTDESEIQIYTDQRIVSLRVKDLALGRAAFQRSDNFLRNRLFRHIDN